MEQRALGGSNVAVSRLCFGVLTMGPLQANLPLNQGASLLEKAFDLGVNFYDTAELYGTYSYLRQAFGGNPEVVIATKSYAVTFSEMQQSIEKARKELDLDRIPIFLLHEQTSAASFRGHQGAWDALVEARSRGLVSAIGLSTHTIEGVYVASACRELDIIHPLFNQAGWGLYDGSAQDMADAISTAAQMGKGIYAMKALAGGHLRHDSVNALRFALDTPGVAAVAVGIQSIEELRFNVQVCQGQSPSDDDSQAIQRAVRRLHVESWCKGCGLCVKRCPFGALSIKEGQAVVHHDLCMTCGYCSKACPEVALKVL